MRLKLPVKIRMKFFYVTVAIMSVYLFLFYLVIEIWFQKTRSKDSTDTSVDLPFVIVHLDLKGAAPKLEYLESLLPMMKGFGANGLLLEYEDMFPYEGKLLHSFISQAVNLGFEIIPLIQTFGHMEYALKLLEFTHLREDPLFPDSICPSRVESAAFVRHMLEQVIQFHNEVKPLNYIHIGCDEVFHVKKCERCRHRNESKIEILLQHVKKTTEVVKKLSPNTTAMIWDDILQTRDPLLLNPVDLDVEPVSWCYKPKMDVSVVNFYKYPPNFKNIWVASAFKGADGSTSILPDIKDRIQNNLNWMKLILEYTIVKDSVFVNRAFNFKGIILTGWSRYSHMSPLCDILPASIPSLVMNLILIKKITAGVEWNDLNKDWTIFYKGYIQTDVVNYFGCNIIEDDDYYCTSDEIKLYNDLKEFKAIREDIVQLFHNGRDDMSVLEYYFKIGLVNMNDVSSNYFKCNQSLNKLFEIERKIVKTLTKFYDKHVVDEYTSSVSYYYRNLLRNTMKEFEMFVQIKPWEKNSQKTIVIKRD